VDNLEKLNISILFTIGGDGTMKGVYEISKEIEYRNLDIALIGIPKTIDNDLAATDTTFGFPTAVEIATDAVDKLVTTAASHNRILILEVMGREAGWIALHSAVAGGAEVCLIPEIKYDIDKIIERINKRIHNSRGFVNIVISEGACPINGRKQYQVNDEFGHHNSRLGEAGNRLMHELKEHGVTTDIRVTLLGHLQRGGKPIAYDRILATQLGVKAFEMALNKEFGKMAALQNGKLVSVPINEAIEKYHFVDLNSDLMNTARSIGISFGD
jgi:6-phosphofructokinase 1